MIKKFDKKDEESGKIIIKSMLTHYRISILWITAYFSGRSDVGCFAKEERLCRPQHNICNWKKYTYLTLKMYVHVSVLYLIWVVD